MTLRNDYAAFLDDLKTCIQASRTRTALAVNHELIVLYWEIRTRHSRATKPTGFGARKLLEICGRSSAIHFDRAVPAPLRDAFWTDFAHMLKTLTHPENMLKKQGLFSMFYHESSSSKRGFKKCHLRPT
jgi:hypothetical protein